MRKLIGVLTRLAFGGAVAILASTTAVGADCSVTSVGFVPINDLAAGQYQGFDGGLYPGGANLLPPDHAAAGIPIAQAIGRMDADGRPDPSGQYGLISIGMSNTSREFDAFVEIANSDSDKDPGLVVVNGAQGGATASDWADSSNAVWTGAMQRLAQASLTADQVAVAWIKLANSAGQTPPIEYRNTLQVDLEQVTRIAVDKFPNLKLAYFGSRIYAGYATTTLNPEPYAYESGFVVKWLIEKQLGGDGSLNFDVANGPVTAPWVAWGPYLWADGLVPRNDGLVWECNDLDEDGTHPSEIGRQKVAAMLANFFRTDATAREWYLANVPQDDVVAPAPPTNLIIEQ